MITVSELPRLDLCPSSAALPQVRTASKWSDDGDGIHAFMETALTAGRDAALDGAPDDLRERCRDIDVGAVLGALGLSGEAAQFHAEVSVAWHPDLDAGRKVGIKRDYHSAHEAEMVGTADLAILDGERVVVPDWKTGHLSVEHPRTNLQVRAYALMWSRIAGVSQARAVIAILRDGEKAVVLTSDLDAMDLDAVAGRIRDVLTRVAAAKASDRAALTFNEGDHCRYCPAFASCPAKANAAQTLVPIADRLPELTPEYAGTLYGMLDRYDDAAKRMRAHVEEYARNLPDGIPLEGGVRLVERDKEGNRVVSPAVAIAVLAENSIKLPPPEKIAITAIEKAAGGKKAGAAILATIEARGGVTRPVTRKLVTERDPS